MLKGFKIRGRLFLGFGVLMALVIGIIGWVVLSGSKTATAVSEADRTSSIVVGLKDALLSVRQGRVLAWQYVATGNDTVLKGRDDAFAKFESRYADIQKEIVRPVGRQLTKDYYDAVQGFIGKANALCALRTNGTAIDSPAFAAAITDFDAAAKNYAATNDKASKFYEDQSEAQSVAARGQIESSEQITIGVGLIVVVLGASAALIISRGIANPIQSMTTAMGALAAGDLNQIIPHSENSDEIGDMAKAVQVFKDNAIRVERMTREQEEAKLRGLAERKETMLKMANDFEASVMGVVRTVSSSATGMQTTAQAMSSSATQASAQATTVAAAAEQATSNVQTVAAAAEELSASISEISRQVTEAARISTAASEEAARTNATVVALAAAADKIGEVVKLINDIASQTNLLALNATIEAARAGEAGKGFAVVASEVKNLANQTGRATDEIGSQISTVQDEVRRAVEAIRSIGATIEQVRQISSGIASAVEEQGAATQEIARNVQQAAQGTQEVSSNIGGVMEAAANTGTAAEQVLASAGELAQNSDRLRSEVGNFLANVRAV